MNWQPNNKRKKHIIKEKNEFYDPETVNIIKGIYVAAVFLWIVAIFVLDLLKMDLFVWLFLAIPIIIWGINITNLEDIKCCLEDEMFKGNFLSFGFLITIILIHWKSPLESHDKSPFFTLLVVAFLLLMISLVDVWVDHKYLPIVKHVKTILHTAALVILSLALYLYYVSYQKQVQNMV